jgi:hypothetical protein
MFWTETYRQHFQNYFAKPFDIQVHHSPDGAGLKLALHDWARRGFRVYASMGLADILARNEESDFGEVVLFADVPDPQIPQLFINALFFILEHDIPLGSQFAIGFGAIGRDFSRRYGKSAFYFTRPSDDDQKFNEVRQGEAVGRVFQAFFLTPEEEAFLEEHGPDEFEQAFWKQFGGELTPEERCDLLVDKSKSKELEARLEALAQRSNLALSVRRPSCI